jgi:hypothetical protein
LDVINYLTGIERIYPVIKNKGSLQKLSYLIPIFGLRNFHNDNPRKYLTEMQNNFVDFKGSLILTYNMFLFSVPIGLSLFGIEKLLQ